MNIRNANLTFGALSQRARTEQIVLHHTAGTGTVAHFHQIHRNNGWSGIGYHFLVRTNGEIWQGRPIGTVGAHVTNHNHNSIGIAFEGNFENIQMSNAQFQAGVQLVRHLTGLHPNANVRTHRDLAATLCPGRNFPFDRLMTEVRVPTVTTGTHTVAAGENLTVIARQHGTTVTALTELNNIVNPNSIRVGQVLRLPVNTTNRFFPIPSNRNLGLVDSLNSINVNSSMGNRTTIARANGIGNYVGNANQNNQLLTMLRLGQLRRP